MSLLSRLGFPLLAVILLILSAPARSEESCVAAFCVSSSHAPAAGGQIRIDVAITPAGKVRNDHYNIRVPGLDQMTVEGNEGSFSFNVTGPGTFTYSVQACSGPGAKSGCQPFEEFTHLVTAVAAPTAPVPSKVPPPAGTPAPPPVTPPAPAPGPGPSPAGPFTGTWDTQTGTGGRFTIVLTQNGSVVTGTYTPSSGEIAGTVGAGNRLVFTWTQPGATGGGVFQLAADGRSFTGSFSNAPERPLEVASTWNGSRQGSGVAIPAPPPPPTPTPPPAPAPTGFTGTWDTETGLGARYTIVLNQSGAAVTGTYTAANGQITGTIGADGRLIFTWSELGSTGGGVFQLAADGQSFTGSFSNAPDRPLEVANTWNGSRQGSGVAIPTPAPPPPAPAPPPIPNAPATFDGTWTSETGGREFILTLTQVSDRVYGTYSPNNGMIVGRVVDGTLTYYWKQDGAFGAGTFRLAGDNQSFTGSFSFDLNPAFISATWNGTRTSLDRPPIIQIPFTGVWSTASSGGGSWTMSLTQNGQQVLGTYAPNGGNITGGTDTIGFMAYAWTQGAATGGGMFQIMPDGRNMMGTFSNDQNQPFRVDGLWWGTRQ